MTRKFTISWPDFGSSMKAVLRDDENPELCESFWAGLPFRTLFVGSMSSGEMFKVPVPFILPDLESNRLAYLPDEPVGAILAMPMMGILMVRWGIVVEPFRLPRVGQIEAPYLAEFAGVARRLRDAYFFTKAVNAAIFARE